MGDIMSVVNIVEQLIWDYIDEVLDRKPGICRCETCRMDMVAYALNRVKPRYAVTDKGETIARAQFLDRQLYLDIIVNLTEAANIVSAKPRHEVGISQK